MSEPTPSPRRSDEDWVGEPPEGRHSRDRARPGYWESQWQAVAAKAILPVLIIVVVVVILLLA